MGAGRPGARPLEDALPAEIQMDARKRRERYFDREVSGRGRGLVFAGRTREIGHIVRQYRDGLERSLGKDMLTAGINLFTGPPGMGKTSMLREAEMTLGWHIEERYQGAPKLRPLIARAAPEDLTTLGKLRRACIENVQRSSELRNQAVKWTLRVTKTGLRALPWPGTDEIADSLGEHGEIALEERPLIVLFVDEVQRSTEDNREVYGKLHTGETGLPIIPVFAGLSDSLHVLEERAGITRIGPNMRFELQMLEDAETRGVVDTTAEELQIELRPHEKWIRAVVEDSKSLPEHLHTALLAIVQEARERGEGRVILDEGALERVRSAAEAGRKSYYASRAKGFNDDEVGFVSEVLKRMKEREETPVRAASTLLARVRKNDPDGILQLESEKPKDFVERMVHQGLLQVDEDRRYTEAIPSFTGWMIENYGLEEEYGRDPDAAGRPAPAPRAG